MKALVISLVLVHGVASADTFVTMDRQDRSSFVGFEASVIGDTPLDGDLLRFDVHGQAVSRDGFGIYGTLPFATLSGPDGAATIGDIEIGGIFVPQLRSMTLILHAGITAPTGTNGLDDGINFAATGARIADYYLALPRATSLRFGASPIIRSGQLIMRGDFGVDVNLDVDDRGTANTVIRLDGAIGVDLGNATLTGELANTFDTGRGAGWIDTAAVALRFRARTVHPYIAVVFALDDDARAFFHDAFTFGLDFPLR